MKPSTQPKRPPKLRGRISAWKSIEGFWYWQIGSQAIGSCRGYKTEWGAIAAARLVAKQLGIIINE